jgi:spore germination cell wall hydrolase CwlJ-like protein
MRKVISIGIGVLLMCPMLLTTSVVKAGEEEVIETNIPELNTLEIQELTQDIIDVIEDTDIEQVQLTQQEETLLMQVARAESGTSLKGQLWAMRTILNRVGTHFGDNVTEVITAKNQFEVYSKGIYKRVELVDETYTAMEMIKNGWDETEGALYWRSDRGSKNSWHEKNLHYIKTVEGNRYYR